MADSFGAPSFRIHHAGLIGFETGLPEITSSALT